MTVRQRSELAKCRAALRRIVRLLDDELRAAGGNINPNYAEVAEAMHDEAASALGWLDKLFAREV